MQTTIVIFHPNEQFSVISLNPEVKQFIEQGGFFAPHLAQAGLDVAGIVLTNARIVTAETDPLPQRYLDYDEIEMVYHPNKETGTCTQ